MQDKIYIELKQKESNIASLHLQLTYNFMNNKDFKDIELRLNIASKDLQDFKKVNHL